MSAEGRGRGRGHGQGNEGGQGNEQVAEAIQRMADVLERMAGQQGPGQGANPGNHNGGVEGEDKALERFQKFSPPKFLGGPNPEDAEIWLERMTDIFAALGYPEERQVAFSVFQFEGPARAWWNVIRVKFERDQIPLTWLNFTREFNEKYLPPIVQER
mgnify:CR=1 FL=1